MSDKFLLTAGIDVGSSAIKTVVMADHGESGAKLLAHVSERIRKRDPVAVVDHALEQCLHEASTSREDLEYIATTGEGEAVEYRTGHFYGMTTHARGGLFLNPEARAVIDIGALHTRAVLMDDRAKVLGYRMTSQCASGSGQFLENISRYLGVTLEEIGQLSIGADDPESCSSICAVLAETDVINMVSRGISTANILKGIHQSMAGRYVRLLVAAGARETALVTGGLASDVGMVRALEESAAKSKKSIKLVSHPLSVYAGAIGAALWGAYRSRHLKAQGHVLGGV